MGEGLGQLWGAETWLGWEKKVQEGRLCTEKKKTFLFVFPLAALAAGRGRGGSPPTARAPANPVESVDL